MNLEDKMHRRKKRSVDLMLCTVKQSKEFSLKEGYLERIGHVLFKPGLCVSMRENYTAFTPTI